MWLKPLVNRILSKVGYQIERFNQWTYTPIDVFDLAVDKINPHRPDFFFIQIGANDGVMYDPIRKYVLRYHWQGMLVEPNPAAFAKLVAGYRDEKGLLFENAAVTSTDGDVVLFCVDEQTVGANSSLYSTMDKKSLVQVFGPRVRYSEKRFPGVSVATPLSKYSVSKIDLLQVDTEGYDFENLKLFDLNLYKPSLIRLEHAHLSVKQRQECYRYLDQHGYDLSFTVWDTIALSRSAYEQHGPPNLPAAPHLRTGNPGPEFGPSPT